MPDRGEQHNHLLNKTNRMHEINSVDSSKYLLVIAVQHTAELTFFFGFIAHTTDGDVDIPLYVPTFTCTHVCTSLDAHQLAQYPT